MDRRKFLTGVGSIGAVTTGLALRQLVATQSRTDVLASAGGASHAAMQSPPALTRDKTLAVSNGLLLGHLPGSAGMFANPGVERAMQSDARGVRWSTWNGDTMAQITQPGILSPFKTSRQVVVSIGVLHVAEGMLVRTLKTLDIVAHFAIDDAPYFAPFSAWQHEVGTTLATSKSTQPISFAATVPDYVALEVNYALNPSAIAGAVPGGGSIYLPVGASGESGKGLSTGLYVLVAPSASTGILPDLSNHSFSGDVRAPMSDSSGRALDFDYLTIAIRPVFV